MNKLESNHLSDLGDELAPVGAGGEADLRLEVLEWRLDDHLGTLGREFLLSDGLGEERDGGVATLDVSRGRSCLRRKRGTDRVGRGRVGEGAKHVDLSHRHLY